jgi:hypothetical protein
MIGVPGEVPQGLEEAVCEEEEEDEDDGGASEAALAERCEY